MAPPHELVADLAQLRTALARAPAATPQQPAAAEPVGGERPYRSPARYLWARLIARIYEVFPLLCTQCGAEICIISFVIDTASVTRILEHIGEPAKPPRLSPARAPPIGEQSFAQTPLFDPLVPAPDSAFVVDQRITW